MVLMGSSGATTVEGSSVDWAVLVKVVGDPDRVPWDPHTRALRRDGAELFVNPFDQRALRVALDLRRPGERVSVLSMGPPSAERVLAETYALGVDRAVLLSDPSLAGSDALVTARVLELGLRPIAASVVLTGAWSTDSDTGQVGPAVASLAGWPFVGPARQLTRVDPDRWDVVADSEDGWTRYHRTGPAVFSIGEKAAKLRKSTPEELDRARARAVERWGLAELGLVAREVGFVGSPTLVADLTEEAPHRRPHLIAEGGPRDRADAAMALLPQLLGDSIDAPASAPRFGAVPPSAAEFLVLATSDAGLRDPGVSGVFGELRRRLPEVRPVAAWVGRPPNDGSLSELGRWGASHCRWIGTRSRALAPETVEEGCERILGGSPRALGFAFPGTPFGRAVAATLSARRGLGLVGDATRLGSAPNHSVTFSKPAFGGRVLATIECRTRPALVTVRPGAFGTRIDDQAAPASVEQVPYEPPVPKVEVGESVQELDGSWGDLGTARVVLVVGQGIGGSEAIGPLRELVVRWGGALGATRKVVDAGWVPRQLQVGLTGRSIAPEIALLVGVGGSANHLVGLQRARVVMAVNPEPTARVLGHADVGIVGRWEEIVPLLDGPILELVRTRGY